MVNILQHTPRQTRKLNLQGLQGLRARTTACKRGISWGIYVDYIGYNIHAHLNSNPLYNHQYFNSE